MIIKKIFSLLFSILLIFSFSCKQNVEPVNPNPTPDNPPSVNPPDTDVTISYPSFSPIGGFYKEKQTVTITCDNSTAIYYTILKQTLDEQGNWDEQAWQEAIASSIPTENSTKYTGPFEISEQCIIRAMAVKADGTKNYAMTCFDFDLDRSTDFVNVGGSINPTNPESINWQDQTIYFILTDRFFNGDTSNDKSPNLVDKDGNPYDESIVLPGQPASGYNGGDIEGVRQKLQYIKDLGFTAIWLTPPVKCQVAESNYHGFHGYWASDFTKVDPHMGTMEQYQQFVKEAHDMGLYVIQDIVVNHCGDYQKITKPITESDLKENQGNISNDDFYLEPKSIPFSHPEQLPWALNHINNLTLDEFKNNSFYHFNPGIADYTNKSIMHTYSSSDLDDIATENPVVRNLLRGYFRYWIDKVGIDGYRIDTVKYVEPDFFEDFINSTEPNNMGVREYAHSIGKTDFINFGEAWDSNESLVGSYSQSENGTPRIDGMIYFPLRFVIADTISSGSKTSTISETLSKRYTQNYYANPDRLVTFIDNHDTDRWGQTMKGNTELMKAAYGIMYTIPGIPQVYYGSEQGFDGECRAGMFEGSFLAPGTTQTEDKFDTTNDWYVYFKRLNKMRKDNRVFRYNTLYTLQDTDDSAGILAYIVREKDESGKTLSGVGNKAIYVMNTASTDKILDASYLNLKVGDKFELIDTLNAGIYEGVSAAPSTGTSITTSFVATADANDSKKGNIKLVVPANSCAIYLLTEVGTEITEADCTLTVDEVPTEKITGNSVTIKGTSTVTGKLKIVLNGDYTLATEIDVAEDIQFSKDINISAYSNGTISVQLIQTVGTSICYSDTASFVIERPFTLVAKYTDPKDDDNGVGVAKGKLSLPTEPGFKGQFDIQGVDVYRSGNDIRLGVKMKSISRSWDPTSNFFDHVVFYVFISDGDDSTGCQYHSKNTYELPNTFGKWDYMFQCNGWGNGYYSSNGADFSSLGVAITPSAKNEPTVNWEEIDKAAGETTVYTELDWTDYNPEIGSEWQEKPGMIWFTISAAAMGYPSDISGYKFYINNYDFDMGNPRGMVEGDPEQWKFGTGSISLDECPRVVDETDEIIIIN